MIYQRRSNGRSYVAIITLVTILWVSVAAVDASELFIGTASVNITPSQPVALSGQRRTRIAHQVESPVTATALAIETRDGEKVFYQAIMVSCDLAGIRDGIQDRVRERVKARLSDFNVNKLFLGATHTGQNIWSRTVNFDRTMPTHETNRYCGTTPASNGTLIVVWHGSAGLHCYDMDGKPQWKLELGEFRHAWGYGTSPVIDGDRVILSTGPGKEPFVAAYDLKTGKQRWKLIEARPGKADRTTTSTFYGSWSTPILRLIDGKKQLICCMPTRALALAPETGKEIWICTGLNHDRGDLAYSSPIVADRRR